MRFFIITTMSKSIVLVDGQNFLKISNSIIEKSGPKKVRKPLVSLKLKELVIKTLRQHPEISQSEIYFYSAKLKIHPETEEKSKELITEQRKLKNDLEKQGVKFLISGNVRPQEERNSKGKVTGIKFKEKGVDVKVAVDMVAMACDKRYETIVLCSSDSDLQPAVAEAQRRGIKVIYLGFKTNPNKGLIYTTDKAYLFTNEDIINAFGYSSPTK